MNEKLKNLGYFLAGLGILLIGIASLIYVLRINSCKSFSKSITINSSNSDTMPILLNYKNYKSIQQTNLSKKDIEDIKKEIITSLKNTNLTDELYNKILKDFSLSQKDKDKIRNELSTLNSFMKTKEFQNIIESYINSNTYTNYLKNSYENAGAKIIDKKVKIIP